MNKVFNINLGGIVFTIDDVAFEKLNNYINKLKVHFANTEGANDIIMDIEARMAELIHEKLTDPTSIVNENIVIEVIAVMGDVNELDEENQSDGNTSNDKKTTSDFHRNRQLRRDTNNKVLAGVCSGVANYFDVDPTLVRIMFILVLLLVFGSGGLLYIILWIVMKPAENTDQVSMNYPNKKHLFRDADDKVLGGVCSGISNYIGTDAVWVRLFFALAFFGFGAGFLIYIILWIVVPKAITPTQKLQMKGDPIDVSNIEREVKNTFNNAKQNTPKVASEMKSIAGNAAHAIAEIATTLLKAFGKIFAFALLLLGIFGTVLLTIFYFGISKTIYINEFFNMCVGDGTVLTILKFGAFFIVSATLLSLIVTSFRLLFNLKFKKGPVYSVLSAITFIGFALFIYGGVEYIMSVESKASFTQNIPIEKHDTLYLSTAKKDFDSQRISIIGNDEDINFSRYFSISDEGILQQSQKLRIKKSSSDSVYVEVKRTSHGEDKSDAIKLAEQFRYNIVSNNSSLIFDQGIFIPKNEKWKYPDLKLTLNIPIGIVVNIDEGISEMLNRYRFNDDYYSGKTFIMTDKGLKCMDCKDVSSNEDTDEDKNIKDVKIDWSVNDDDSTETGVHIITKNKKVIIKDGKKVEVEEKRIGPMRIKIERHKDDND